MKNIKIFIFAALSAFVLSACESNPQAKYVFYFIGDGMGPNQILGTEMYLADMEGRLGYEPLCFTQFPVAGMARTYSASSDVTDSAAGGTALASGQKTTNGFVGVLPDSTVIPTIAELCKKKGMGVAICTSVSIDHATPACFYAHEPGRKRYYEIGTWLPASGVDFIAGAGFIKPYNKNDETAPMLYDLAQEAEYTIARGIEDYEQKKVGAKKMMLIQATDALPENNYKSASSIPMHVDHVEGALTLEQITRAAIDFTPKENGFFMMIEGGMIDWGSHSNDAMTAFGEVLEFDKAIKVAYEFYLKHPKQTLIVISADHETGGLSLARDGEYWLKPAKLDRQKKNGTNFVDKLYAELDAMPHEDIITNKPEGYLKAQLQEVFGMYDEEFGITADEEQAIMNCIFAHYKCKRNIRPSSYGEFYELDKVLTRIFDKRANIAWTTTGHTAANVPVIAIGAGAEQFDGWQDNIEIVKKIAKLAGVEW